MDNNFLNALPPVLRQEVLEAHGVFTTKSGRLSKRPRALADNGYGCPPPPAKRTAKKRVEPKIPIEVEKILTILEALPSLESGHLDFLRGHIQNIDQQTKVMMNSTAQIATDKDETEKLLEKMKVCCDALEETKKTKEELSKKIEQLESGQTELVTKWKQAVAGKQEVQKKLDHLKEGYRELLLQIDIVQKQLHEVMAKEEKECEEKDTLAVEEKPAIEGPLEPAGESRDLSATKEDTSLAEEPRGLLAVLTGELCFFDDSY